MPERTFLRFLRASGLIAVLLGAVGSVGLMFYTGRRNPSRLLILLFVMWDLSPFVVLFGAHVMSKGWSIVTRAALYIVMLILAFGSVAVYANVVFGPPRAQPA